MPNLAIKEKCTGCTACASTCPNHCIEMKKDQNGFRFPEILNPVSCNSCGACQRVCPVISQKVYSDLPIAYAAYSKDESLRMESSSGGIFSEIAKLVIEKKGVVYGAAYNDAFEVYHCCVETVDDLAKLRGAKYSESYLGNTFSEILKRIKQGQYVLFAGMPCQVAGLKSFIKKDFENLICIDFVCHGVPSPMVWEEYINYRAKIDADGKLPISINLRSKATGWSRYQYSNFFQYGKDRNYSCGSSQDLFMKLFVYDYILRPSCGNCIFKGYSRVSDITLGDFWGIWDIDPKFDDNKGTSVVLIQSTKGRLLWNEAKDSILYKKVTLEQASQQNKAMLNVAQMKENREKVLSEIRRGNIAYCEELFVDKDQSVLRKIKRNVKSFLYNLNIRNSKKES